MNAAPNLIEAAPDLFDALTAVLQDCARREAMFGDASVRLSTDVRRAANRAIAKARQQVSA